ncbi:MAG: hypothetical protein JNL50_02165, partial [Phycisphaerae bacterium]|nr:hypothetical protein [Phycisphaerae bacterium]
MADRILIAVAAGREARAVLDALSPDAPTPDEWCIVSVGAAVGAVDVLRTGVGKSNAAGATARFLDPAR